MPERITYLSESYRDAWLHIRIMLKYKLTKQTKHDKQPATPTDSIKPMDSLLEYGQFTYSYLKQVSNSERNKDLEDSNRLSVPNPLQAFIIQNQI